MSRRQSALVGLLILIALAVLWYRSRVLVDNSLAIQPTIVVVTGGSSPYWQSIGKGAQAAAKDFDAKVDVRMPKRDEDVEAQSQLLLALKQEEVDALALSPLNAEEQTRVINQLAEAMLVVTIDSDAPLSNRLSYVGASNIAAGQQCAKLVKEAVPDGGKLAVLLANLTKSNTLERKQGFDDTLLAADPAAPPPTTSAPNYEVVEYLVDEGDVARCETQLRALLAAHDDLACIVGMNAYHGPLLVRVLKDAGRLDDVKLVTFDTVDETLAGIEAGDIYATIAQDPYEYGYESIRLLTSYCRRRDKQMLPPPGVKSTMTISTNPIRQDNVATLGTALSGRTATNDQVP